MSSSVTTPDPSRAEKRVFNPTPEFSSNGTGIVADPRSRDHDTGTWHPDQPTRFTAVMNSWNGSVYSGT